jgi:hypothetical protein
MTGWNLILRLGGLLHFVSCKKTALYADSTNANSLQARRPRLRFMGVNKVQQLEIFGAVERLGHTYVRANSAKTAK